MSTDENTPLFFSHPLPSASVSSGFASPCYHRSHSPSPSLPLDDSKESFLLSTLVRENQLHEWRISELEREMVGLRERALPFGAFFICSRKRRSGAFHPPLLLPHFLRFQVSPRMLPFFFFFLVLIPLQEHQPMAPRCMSWMLSWKETSSCGCYGCRKKPKPLTSCRAPLCIITARFRASLTSPRDYSVGTLALSSRSVDEMLLRQIEETRVRLLATQRSLKEEGRRYLVAA